MSNPIRRSAAPLSEPDLAAAEARHGLTLPAGYRAFLLAHNGGVPRRAAFRHTSGNGCERATWVRYFHLVGRGGLGDPDWDDLGAAFAGRPLGLPAGVLPVADAHFRENNSAVCLASVGPDAGKVYFRPDVDPDEPTLYPAADGWGDFVSGLTAAENKPKAWRDAIVDGDLDELRTWLGDHREKPSDGRVYGELIEAAVEENSRPALVLLFEFGGEPASAFTEAMRTNRFEVVARLPDGGHVHPEAARSAFVEATPFLWHLPPLLGSPRKAGAGVDRQNDSGETPLHRAVEARSPDGVAWLLARGADPTAAADDDRTPLQPARRLEATALADLPAAGEADWAARQPPADEATPFDLYGVTFARSGPPLTLADIVEVERNSKRPFPPEYRWLLPQTNGGVPSAALLPASRLPRPDDEGDEAAAREWDVKVVFLPLRAADIDPTALAAEGDHDDTDGMGLRDPVEEAVGWRHDTWEMLGSPAVFADPELLDRIAAAGVDIGKRLKKKPDILHWVAGAGDLAGRTQAAMGALLPEVEAKVAALAAGDWGTGPPAADLARKSPGGPAVVAELEAYAAARSAGGL